MLPPVPKIETTIQFGYRAAATAWHRTPPPRFVAARDHYYRVYAAARKRIPGKAGASTNCQP
jgi:hypothetical protein